MSAASSAARSGNAPPSWQATAVSKAAVRSASPALPPSDGPASSAKASQISRAERVPDGPDGHERDWIQAIKGGSAPTSSFDYSGPLSETVLMGNLAVRFPGKPLLWDGEAMKVTNDADADAYVRRNYREGWHL